MTSLKLNTDHDLCLDGGTIALAINDDETVQSVSCACTLIKNESWYKTQRGIPYFNGSILGSTSLTASDLSSIISGEAEKVKNVAKVKTAISINAITRKTSALIAVVTTSGNLLHVEL